MGDLGRSGHVVSVTRMASRRARSAEDDAARLDLDDLARSWGDASRFIMIYRFALYEITTKINILREEFGLIHDYNPIEHVDARLKSVEAILAKARRLECGLTVEEVRANVRDIAGVRVTCSFRSDVYTIFDMFCDQADVTVVEVEDYIEKPKPNGYQSLHAIVGSPCSCPAAPSWSMSRCSSGRWRWISGPASSTRSITSTTATYPRPWSMS